ncbi:MAG TPA: YeeE/YedE thiosulfate transporter family protein [Burkholderiaceae bacterium]|nr:YeeE/YedE thiosulfate transporter family protein [Burkholderiaceae bacterium]
MTQFTPWSALAGGALIGLAAVALLAADGRIAGVSGIAAGLWGAPRGDRAWRWLFNLGLVVGAGAWTLGGLASVPVARPEFPAPLLVVAGLLVGYGTSLAGGCTSGHGVCGLARFSSRSLVATLVFLGVAMLTTFIVRHGLHVG